MNGTILIGEEFAEPIEELSDAQAGELFKAILRYGTDQELPETDDQAVTILFMLLKGYIDRMAKKYEDRCQKNRKNGQLGGRPPKTERIEEKPNGFDENPKNPNQIQNQNQNQIQNQNQNKEGRFTPPTAEQVRAYAHGHGLKINADRFVDFYSSKGWMVGKAKMKDWQAAVRNWAARDRQEAPETKKTDYRSMMIAHAYGEAST